MDMACLPPRYHATSRTLVCLSSVSIIKIQTKKKKKKKKDILSPSSLAYMFVFSASLPSINFNVHHASPSYLPWFAGGLYTHLYYALPFYAKRKAHEKHFPWHVPILSVYYYLSRWRADRTGEVVACLAKLLHTGGRQRHSRLHCKQPSHQNIL